MGETKHRNHFIQKAFVKEFFGGRGIVNYVKINTNEYGKIDINSYESKIVINDFHSDEIENGMMNLESQGIQLIRKINKQITEGKIFINRKESLTIRFYLLLGVMRSSMSRGDIENLQGDEWFNETMSNSKGTSQEIHEEKIGELLRMFELFRTGKDFSFEIREFLGLASQSEDMFGYLRKNMTVKRSVQMALQNSIVSRLKFFEFEEAELILQEKPSFQEISRENSPRAIYNFFPISENHGIMLINKSFIERELGGEQEQSIIFQTDLSKMHEMNYVRIDEIKKDLVKYLKSNNFELNVKNQQRWYIENMHKYNSEDDTYAYEVNIESSEVADFCNAMISVHNQGGIAMYVTNEQISRMHLKKEQFGIFDIATGK